MTTLSLDQFRRAFKGILRLDDCGTDKLQKRCLGGAEGVGLDLVLAECDSDRLESAALQFGYVEGATQFDQFSLRCVGVFLSVVFDDTAAADRWIALALEQLKGNGVSSCTTTHAGFSLRLMQMKPYAMFLLTVTDDFPEKAPPEDLD